MPNETVDEWLRKPGVTMFVRRSIARCWLEYIREAGCTDIENTRSVLREVGDVCYQFLHRTASACYKVDTKNDQKAVLVYELFYDAKDQRSVEDCAAFKAELRRWAGILRLKNMKFLILSVPIVNAAEVKKLYEGCKEELFEEMKLNTIYRFDFDAATVEDVGLPMDNEKKGA